MDDCHGWVSSSTHRDRSEGSPRVTPVLRPMFPYVVDLQSPLEVGEEIQDEDSNVVPPYLLLVNET